MEQNQVAAEKETYAVPWSIMDTWIGIGMMVVLNLIFLAVVLLGFRIRLMQNAGILFAELIYLLPIVLIFAWRRISWKHLGFGKFTLSTLGLGCGLVIIGYVLIVLHNSILSALGIDTQGDQISQIFSQLKSPIWLLLVSVVVAPPVEEIFFRGFLFQGFRQKYGWLGATLLSSFIFAAAHLDPVAFLPVFILGCVLAYVYQRSNSLWPGIIFHFLVNAFGALSIYVLTQFPNLIPS